MIVYFADRQFNILGQASTELPEGLTIVDDVTAGDVETGVTVFECTIRYTKKNRGAVTECTALGNYLLSEHEGKCKMYSIIEAERDTKNLEVRIYAEDDGMDLLNEVVGPYEADKAYAIDHYINKYASGAGFEIGINEAKDLTRKLSWDGDTTASARIASVATQFDGCEVSYSFEIDGLSVKKKFINIYKERGKDVGVTLRLNEDIDSIITTESIANIATALKATGGTPEDENYEDDIEPTAVTLKGYQYDDGDFYVDGELLKSREALKRWSRYLWKTEESQKQGGHIVKQFSYDTTSQSELCSRTITELKKVRDIEANYKVTINKKPENVDLGDRINIVDDEGELYLSGRVLELETSVQNQTFKVTLGEYLIKTSGINQQVQDLAAQFAKQTISVHRALTIADAAKTTAEEAKDSAYGSAGSSSSASSSASAALAMSTNALAVAQEAQEKANAAEAAVDTVEKSVETLETTVSNAQQAADNAQQAANTAQEKANDAATAAAQAIANAADAHAAADLAQSTADTAVEKADTAQTTADTAKTTATTAKETADAAKADAAKAQADIEEIKASLISVTSEMEVDYARETDLTATEARLQSQISQNAAQITSLVSEVVTIDETANNAQEQAAAAQTAASTAQAQADQATAEAQAAQAAADNAATAAATAQSEADVAKAAAANAQSVADKAQTDLRAAQADLATVSSRVDATEEEITNAQAAVEAAQLAANNAKADADAAAKKATSAQSTADTAVTNAANAQTSANEAASNAALAQKTADEAKGNASAAQARAEEAVNTAAEAQRTANNAVTNASNAQAVADAAAQAAADAQSAADDADAKAAQAASDLAEARRNLADVTSRVGATEEEVAAAQSAVITAQNAAEQAHEEAETAQATANTAKENAATAQTVANNAKTAADNAQLAAEEAQQAADDAQAAVDSLAVRMTSAETKVLQNSEQIALMAKKTEVTETLGGYFTKEETESAITLESDEIKSTVRETYATSDRVSTAESLIQQLSNCISLLVTDENGESLMTQTENGWTFSMKETAEAVSSLTSLLETLQQETGSTQATVETLQQAVSDHGETLDYVHITEYENEPCIELGESDNNFKLLITNTRIMFMNGANVPTYINTNGLVTQNIEVRGEIVQGGYVMLNTADGGWGLLWKGVSS